MAKRKTMLMALREWVTENNIVDRDVLEKRFYQCVEEPDPVKAVAQVKRAMFNRFVASIRNKGGARMAFPVTEKDGATFIHIVPGTKDLEAVAIIEHRSATQQKGNNKTRRAVKQYKKQLEGQLSLEAVWG